MARSNGVAAFAVNFEPGGQSPLDARLVVETKADLIDASTYSANNYYLGMMVVVSDSQEIYVLNDTSKITSSDYSGWTRVDGEGSKVNVVDNLNSTSATDALSANQGKVLNDKIDSLGTVYRVMGSKDNISDVLALTDAVAGDVWNVTNSFTLNSDTYPAGTNVVCIEDTSSTDHDESHWDPLGGIVDLSEYITADEISQTYLTKEEASDTYLTIDSLIIQ